VIAGDTVTVPYNTANGSAISGSDYTAKTDTLTFNAGETSQNITVATINDNDVELQEDFSVQLGVPTTSAAANVSDSDGSCNILVDDAYDIQIADSDGSCNILVDDAYDIQIADSADVAEGVSGSFAVTISPAVIAGDTVTVPYNTANGSAISGSDYTAKTDTLTFNAGETATINDNDVELQEDFSVQLGVPTTSAAANVSDSDGSCNILVDEQTTIDIDNAVAVDENAGNAVFTVILSVVADNNVTVDYTTNDVSAQDENGDDDYKLTQGTLTFTPGQTQRTISVPIVNDTQVELAETFTVDLSNPSANAVVGVAQGTGTINIDDKATIDIDSIAVNENAGNADFTVTLNVAADNNVTVEYNTLDVTAEDENGDDDYKLTQGTLTFAPGQTQRTISVPITNDAKVELPENFLMNIKNPSTNAVIGTSLGTCTINVDEQTTVSIDDRAVDENGGNTVFTVTLSLVAENNVTVDYTTNDDTAQDQNGDNDYTSTANSLTFAPGETQKTISVTIVNDTQVELAETFTVDLSNPSDNATFAKNQGVGTINIDERTTITINDVAVDENAGTSDFVVSLDLAADDDVSLWIATADNTAVDPDDYTAGSGTLTFTPGVTTQTLNIPITNDGDVEIPETFLVNLSSPTDNAVIGDNQGVGTINVDDAYDVVIADSADVAEGGQASFTVTITPPVVPGDTGEVYYTTVDGSALSGSDYTAKTGTLTFNVGESTKNITISTINDGEVEIPETFRVDLTGGSTLAAANPIDPTGTCTILVDDAYDISIADSADVVEGGTGSFRVTITPPVVPGDTVAVGYRTVDGTAKAGDPDFTAITDTLTFTAGQSTQDITVPTNNDTKVEFVENFSVEFTGTSTLAAAIPGVTTGSCNILIDDKYQISINDIVVPESAGNAVFTVSVIPAIQPDPGHTITVDYTTRDGTATVADNDYTTSSGTLTFNASDTSHTIAVPINDDSLVEIEETFFIDLSNPLPIEISNIADTQGDGEIQIDEIYEIAIQDTTVGEGDGTVQFVVTVTPAVQVGYTFAVDYTTVDGTAEDENGWNDYKLTAGTLIFNVGETIRTLVVPIINENLVDPGESFDMLISNNSPVSFTSIIDNRATCQITDNDLYLVIDKSGSGDGDLVAGDGV
jgi:hypothetical protein